MSDTPYFDAYEKRRLEKLNTEIVTKKCKKCTCKPSTPNQLVEVYGIDKSGKEVLLETLTTTKTITKVNILTIL